jgi:uncharacterized lipoprotein YddW (UPF0748 family)
VKVGISPFGIWRPGNPPGIEGFDQYAELYADARLWFHQGWVDYFTPQLYWPIKQEKQSYPKLLAWWAAENKLGRHLWPGNIPSRVTARERGWTTEEIADQIRATRRQPGATGNIHFSMKALMRNTAGVADVMKSVYSEPALVPATPWLGKETPPAPKVSWGPQADKPTVQIQPDAGQARLISMRSKTDDKWSIRVVPVGRGTIAVPFEVAPDLVIVQAINRNGMESPEVRLNK